MRKTALLLIGVFMFGAPALGSGLTEHSQDASFELSYVDTDDAGKTTDLSVGWAYILMDGFVEFGGQLSYLELDPEVGSSSDASAIGPLLIVNFLPESTVTPTLSATVQAIGGDAGDMFDYAAGIAVGLRAFVGDSASVNIDLSRVRGFGKDNFDDVDSTALTVGLSIFFGKK